MFGSASTFNKPANKRMFGVFAGLALATQASGHLFLQNPAPIPESAPKSPLLPDGSDFPCHGAKLPMSGGEKFAAGSSHLLQFDAGDGANTAVHGGGSCQVSVNYGDDPSDPKNWYVIHSMEGGCPTNSAGNLDGQYTGPQGAYSGALQCTDPRANGVDCINSYNFTIPNGMKPGAATIAWTWFNAIGNREMYMNCINAQIDGGDGSEMSELPTMFVANLAGGGLPQCSTTESQSYKFPFAGKYVTTDDKCTNKAAAVSGGACAQDGAPAGGAGAGGNAPPGGAAPSYGSPAPSGGAGGPSGNPPAQQSGPGQVTITTMQTMTSGAAAPTSAAAPPAYSAPASGAPSAAPAAPSAAAPAPYASGSSSLGSGSCAGQPCSNDGEIVCMGNQFGLCNNGCAVPQPLAAGTTCTNGKIAKRDHIRRHVGRAHVREFA